MNRIKLLTEQVANQIAAGEVVERPASVVKELVENSIDADASRITIEIAAGGRSLIRVADDGWGMSRDDALLSLERHATSKIQRAEDLASIQTMGFRGEAVPSIASVSRFVLTTRERENTSGEGTQIVINGGKIQDIHAAARDHGTTVEVRQLFFNLPARRKFLRSEETERSHIQHYLTLAALAHPDIGFTFVQDQRTLWQLPPMPSTDDHSRLNSLRQRLRQLHGGDTPLIPVNFQSRLVSSYQPAHDESDSPSVDVAQVRLWGFIGAPGVSRSTRDEQHVFVNRRPVENRGINFALIEGYHNALMKGRYPVCCLFLEIDPAAVDVNIHPSKREVKFRDEAGVRRLVAQAVRESLRVFHTPPNTPTHAAPPPPSLPPKTPPTSASPFAPAPRQSHFEIDTDPHPNPLPLAPARPAAPPPTSVKPYPAPIPPAPSTPLSQPTRPSPTPPPADPPHAPTHALAKSEPPAESQAASIPPPTPPPLPPNSAIPYLHVPLRLVGVVGRLYVVLESDRGLVLMDQHAAHERILYEQMLRRLEAGDSAPSQRLLLPETVELSPRDAEFVRQNLPTLTRLGVGLTEFGDRTFLLDALPPFVRGSAPKQFAVSLIDELKSAGAGINSIRLGEETIAKTVCRHSVKANDPLRGAELEALIRDLRACEMPYTCPHGRPTLVEMSWRELEKRFGRSA